MIAGMLRANEEEKSILLRLLVGETKQPTRSSWFGGSTHAPSTESPRKATNTHSSSLSKMWVAFLMEVSITCCQLIMVRKRLDHLVIWRDLTYLVQVSICLLQKIFQVLLVTHKLYSKQINNCVQHCHSSKIIIIVN